jgi:hypothetical protein
MAMLAFSHFEKFKNQFQLIRHLIHDMTLVVGTIQMWYLANVMCPYRFFKEERMMWCPSSSMWICNPHGYNIRGFVIRYSSNHKYLPNTKRNPKNFCFFWIANPVIKTAWIIARLCRFACKEIQADGSLKSFFAKVFLTYCCHTVAIPKAPEVRKYGKAQKLHEKI